MRRRGVWPSPTWKPPARTPRGADCSSRGVGCGWTSPSPAPTWGASASRTPTGRRPRLLGTSRPFLDGVVLRVRGLVAAQQLHWAEAEESLTRSVDVLAAQPYPAEHARSLLELARVLHQRRSPTRAAEAFAVAADLARGASDVQLLSLIARAQGDGGTVPVDLGLSTREHAVALSAAAGRTNREIAAAEFVSVRTVETQLSSVYRKLGVRSRSELAALLHRPADEHDRLATHART